MQETVIYIMDSFGYLGLCFLIALENLFPPIPSEAILPFAGFMTTYTRMTVVGSIIFATLGSCIGAIILYWLGTILMPQNLNRLFGDKRVKRLGFKQNDVEKTIKWFEKCGKKAVLFGRCVPIIRSLISIPAGMTKMKFSIFFLYTIIGSAIWNTVLIYFGALLGASWGEVMVYVGKYSEIIQIILIVAVAVYLWKYIKKFRDRKTI